MGRILGPRGMTAKQLEQDTGCKIMVRGKGSMRDKKKVKRILCVLLNTIFANEKDQDIVMCNGINKVSLVIVGSESLLCSSSLKQEESLSRI